jgi:hypothetical protein
MRGWRKLHNDKLHNLYSSSSISRIMRNMRSARHVAQGYKKNVYRILVAKSEEDGGNES